MYVEQVKIGMNAEQVLALIGSPDFIGRGTWDYDMDSKPPYSLTFAWDTRRVGSIERKTPPLWQVAEARDVQIVY